MSNILLTGGTGRIGTQLLRDLIQEGHHVTFTTRSKEKGKNLLQSADISSDNTTIIEINFQAPDWLESFTAQISRKIDILVHAARNLENLKVNEKGRVSPSQIQGEMHMSITVPYELIYLLIENDSELRDIIFLSSMYGVVGPNPSLYDNFHQQSPIHYGIAKAAQIHLTKELAIRLAEKGIRVNCVSYGGVKGRVDDEFLNKYKKLNPLGRMLNEKDLFPPIQFIIDNPDLAMTGENIKVDGGWTIW